jgi:hypothetical protein
MGRNLLPALPQLGQPRQSVAPFDSVERDALCMRITFELGRRRVVFHVLKANARSYRQNGERPLHETTCANSVHCSNVSGAEKFRPKLPYIRRAQTLTALAVVSLISPVFSSVGRKTEINQCVGWTHAPQQTAPWFDPNQRQAST